jgi:glycosyltransferase involved in cell wall biosynthesis
LITSEEGWNVKLLIVVNIPEFFLSHRLPLAIAARAAGHDVSVATGPGAAAATIIELGFPHYLLPLNRSSMNPLAELRFISSHYSLLRRERPDVVHLVTIKPVLYGGIVARIAGVRGILAAISGLGTVFIARGGRAAFVRRIVELLYRCALGMANTRVIFQNLDDRDVFVGRGIVSLDKAILIRGSGVDLADYPLVSEPDGIPVVTLAARLLRDKGVREFVDAIKILRERGVRATFWLAGNTDAKNPTSLSDEEVKGWQEEGLLEALGYCSDIASIFARSNLVVLPSYREGLPKVLVEAAACGRAVITTDVPGCRDAIEPEKTGLLVPARDAAALADAIQKLVEQPEARRAMGANARRFADENFRIETVIEQHLAAYALLANGDRGSNAPANKPV